MHWVAPKGSLFTAPMAPRSDLPPLEDRIPRPLLERVNAWSTRVGLASLRQRLCLQKNAKHFDDTLAEVLVADHLDRQGCDLRWEVPTPAGRQCDFEVTRDGMRFYVHVKRVRPHSDQPHRLTISSRLRVLEQIRRPYVVRIWWDEGLSDQQMQTYVTEASQFIERSHLGEESVIRDNEDRRLGTVHIVAPDPGPNVSLVIGMPHGPIDRVGHLRKLLCKAHRQFMPRETNVILIASGEHGFFDDFEQALLGSHVERWDTHPPSGQRIAHGRALDGFWSGRRRRDARSAGWFKLNPSANELQVRLLHRSEANLPPNVAGLLEALFVHPDAESCRTAG